MENSEGEILKMQIANKELSKKLKKELKDKENLQSEIYKIEKEKEDVVKEKNEPIIVTENPNSEFVYDVTNLRQNMHSFKHAISHCVDQSLLIPKAIHLLSFKQT
jgi:hypothetical protein